MSFEDHPDWQEAKDTLRDTWSKGKEWYRMMRDSGAMEDMLIMQTLLTEDNSVASLMNIARNSPQMADIVCRLASLALGEISVRVAEEL